MFLKDLIERLECEPIEKIVPMGFHNPHSYRGSYDQIAFEPKENAVVGDMLADARLCLGKKFQGYKGGDYVMSEYSTVNIAEYGSCGEEIGDILLDYMFGKFK